MNKEHVLGAVALIAFITGAHLIGGLAETYLMGGPLR